MLRSFSVLVLRWTELRLQDEREDGKGERLNKYVNCRAVALDVNVFGLVLMTP